MHSATNLGRVDGLWGSIPEHVVLTPFGMQSRLLLLLLLLLLLRGASWLLCLSLLALLVLRRRRRLCPPALLCCCACSMQPLLAWLPAMRCVV
jgi:hypothetical protein